MVEEACVSTLAGSWKKKNLPPLFLPPVSCNGGIQYSTLFQNTSKLRRQFRCLRKSTQPQFWNKSERMHSIATGNATHMVFAAADDYIFMTLHRPLHCNECNKNGQRRVQEHVMWLPLPAIPPGRTQINSKLFMVYIIQSWKEGKNVYNVYRVKQTGSRQMTQPERPFEKCSYQNLKFLVIYFTMALQNIWIGLLSTNEGHTAESFPSGDWS